MTVVLGIDTGGTYTDAVLVWICSHAVWVSTLPLVAVPMSDIFVYFRQGLHDWCW